MSLRFSIEQLNPEMRAQAERKLAELAAIGQVRSHTPGDKEPSGWRNMEFKGALPKRVIPPAKPPMAPPLVAPPTIVRSMPTPKRGRKAKPIVPPKPREPGKRGPDRQPRRKRGELVGLPPAQKQRVRRESELERMLDFQMATLRLPAPEREYLFLNDRRFRFDFCWPSRKQAVEVQGMAHRIRERFNADIEKRALALLAGWRVLEVSGRTIRSGQAIHWIEEFLTGDAPRETPRSYG